MKKKILKFRVIDEYHASQPADIRKTLEQLRQIIKQAAPIAKETISNGRPAFLQNKVLVSYALNKKYISFYPSSSPFLHFKKMLEKYTTTKDAIQFSIDKPLPLGLINKIVKFRLNEDKESINKKIADGVVHKVPDDIGKALKAHIDVIERWNSLTTIQRNEWICWVTIVKKSETRAEHILRMVDDLKKGKRQPCCWPGCPHRRPSAQKWFKKLDI